MDQLKTIGTRPSADEPIQHLKPKVDATTLEGKAPGAVLRRCERLGVRCELFGGLVADGFDAHKLSGRRALAGEDVVQLGEELARALVSR